MVCYHYSLDEFTHYIFLILTVYDVLVNTMHCWPNFISIVSWLIEQVQMPEKIKNAFEDHYNPSVQRQYKKYELFHQFIYNVYYTYMAVRIIVLIEV